MARIKSSIKDLETMKGTGALDSSEYLDSIAEINNSLVHAERVSKDLSRTESAPVSSRRGISRGI